MSSRRQVVFVLRFRKCERCERLWAYVKVLGLGPEIDVDMRSFCDCGLALTETGTVGRIVLDAEHAAMLGALVATSHDAPEWADDVAGGLIAKYVPGMEREGLFPSGTTPHPTMLHHIKAALAKALEAAGTVIADLLEIDQVTREDTSNGEA
jgi:hypothetical protein